MSAAIVDVGHIVTTHALAEGDVELADFASYVARAASPYDEVATLDRVAVERALGNEATAETAETLMSAEVLSRSDDDRGPIEIPPRTSRIHDQSRPTTSGQRRTG